MDDAADSAGEAGQREPEAAASGGEDNADGDGGEGGQAGGRGGGGRDGGGVRGDLLLLSVRGDGLAPARRVQGPHGAVQEGLEEAAAAEDEEEEGGGLVAAAAAATRAAAGSDVVIVQGRDRVELRRLGGRAIGRRRRQGRIGGRFRDGDVGPVLRGRVLEEYFAEGGVICWTNYSIPLVHHGFGSVVVTNRVVHIGNRQVGF